MEHVATLLCDPSPYSEPLNANLFGEHFYAKELFSTLTHKEAD
jgi:hypothetical protein